MIRKIAVVATAALIAAGATACEGGADGGGGQQDSGPSGVIFMPMPGVPGAGMPIFF
ncbi:membrane protein [Mycobacterium Phage Rosmarinus]|uniref:Lipoprotein n=6 Tax=Anayavirus TaxID=2946797 RepID=G1BPQ6_9CAUD|nr:hypothetical protein ANGELICA_52 [Mycobacterium phage Angelica]YP_009019031.1 hypothetical protein CL60_gp49 [Mycobacterium phage BarrelRoll]YP_009638045.1 hypothetical protein FGG34_gp48 [Mycobacterium phage JAWS]YP_009952292.1 hypothetical protein I5G89_gp48 [Mycobacterium phage Adephagia]YP_009954331.1 hypothetical protein I5H10_gp49 [Mycobacterium phage Zavala]AID59152.1 hypothetical protein PBI_EMERSON_53 [Mycobacterium phage Emerson]AOQ29110.1 hypothetical protein SEA_HEDWIGODU_52 [M